MFKNDVLNKVLSIVVAIIIWAYVVTAVNPQTSKTIRDIPVTFTNIESLSERNLTVDSNEKYYVDVVIEGTRSATSQVKAKDFSANVDVLGYPKGENSIKVNVTAPDNVKIVDVIPSTISIEIEDMITVKKPIKMEFNGSLPENAEVGFVTMMPEEIEVTGAKSAVDKVEYISAKLDSSKIGDEEKTFIVDAMPVDNNGEIVDNLKLSQDEIEITATLLYKKTVPLKLNINGEISEEYEVTEIDVPENVEVKGRKSDINKVKSLSAKDIDISDINMTTQIPIVFELPKNIEVADGSKDIYVKIVIQGISTKKVEYSGSKVKIEGVPEGYSAHINTGLIEVMVYGDENLLKNFKTKDLTLYIDLSDEDFTEETMDAKVRFRYDKAFNKVEASPESVHVIVNQI